MKENKHEKLGIIICSFGISSLLGAIIHLSIGSDLWFSRMALGSVLIAIYWLGSKK
ncbi:MAG: hypothetical protein HC806_07645 [Anaerolineae bacterium]|nr:hypothetical protein [Anaerolineae bacterium]